MIQFGNNEIKEIYVGSDKIKEVYYGSEKVWGEIESIQDGYWVHKDTGVKTYFDLDADFITDGIMSTPPWRRDCYEVNIPEGVTSLGEECLYSSPLTSITLPESVTSLGDYCFEVCNAFTSITLPEGVTSLGGYCFVECTSLTLATVLPAIPPSLGAFAFDSVHLSFNIKVRPPYVDAYKAATNWVAYADKISAI